MFGSSHKNRRTHRAVEATDHGSGRLDMDLEYMIEEYSSLIFHVAHNILHDTALAEDVVQETVIKVWRNQDGFRGDSSVKTWLVRIARNTAIDTQRRQKERLTPGGRVPDTVDDTAGADTERVAQGRAALSDLSSALDQLDELSRTIIVLREVNGMAYADIAEALEVSEATVKTRLMRARRALQESLRSMT